MHTYRTHPRNTLLLVALTILAIPSLARSQEIQWRHNYEAALRESHEKNRPIFVDFYTDNCFWCRKLDASTFRNPSVVELLNERFVPLKLDANRERLIAQALQIRRFPTMVFAAPDGTILGTQEGFLDPADIRQRLNKALVDTALQAAAARTESADTMQD